MKNQYQTLGLKANANHDEIKKAYRKLALKFHPDKNIGDVFFDELFRDVKDAYDILSNPILKKEYDIQYFAFINAANKRTTTYQPRPSEKKESYARTKSETNEFIRIKNNKIRLLVQITLFALPFLGFYFNGFLGFITIIGLYGSSSLFINAVYNFEKIKDFRALIFRALVSPVISIIIFIQILNFFDINPANFFKHSFVSENTYVPYVKNKEKQEVQQMVSKFKGNQLENGASPLDGCFGKGIYSQNAWLEFDNSNKTDAVVCLVRSTDQITIRNEYIRANAKFEMSKIPTGTYYIKVYYGNDWNPNIRNFCGINGAFESNVSFSKSDKIGDQIKIENTSRSYTTGTITLYAVENGNMTTEIIDEEDFFETS